MRIAICIKRDLYGVLALQSFVTAAGPSSYRVFCSVKTRPAENSVESLTHLKTLERDAALNPLLWPTSSVLSPNLQPFSEWQDLTDLRSPGGADRILDWQPDIVVSMRFSLIFPPWLIARIPEGIVNVHPGPLPAYRGLFAPFWQAMHGMPYFDCAVHLVDEGIDTGPVIDTARVSRVSERSLMWHTAQLYREGARIAAAAASILREGGALETVKSAGGGAYYRFPSSEDFSRLAETGMDLVSGRDYAALLSEIFPAGKEIDC
jgi:hypothetical protein